MSRGFPVISEDTLRRAAWIIGQQSAAGKALADIALRRSRGENPICLSYGSSLLVIDASALAGTPGHAAVPNAPEAHHLPAKMGDDPVQLSPEGRVATSEHSPGRDSIPKGGEAGNDTRPGEALIPTGAID